MFKPHYLQHLCFPSTLKKRKQKKGGGIFLQTRHVADHIRSTIGTAPRARNTKKRKQKKGGEIFLQTRHIADHIRSTIGTAPRARNAPKKKPFSDAPRYGSYHRLAQHQNKKQQKPFFRRATLRVISEIGTAPRAWSREIVFFFEIFWRNSQKSAPFVLYKGTRESAFLNVCVFLICS